MTGDDAALLLVDDVPENLLALEAALAPLGHRMVTARSGDEALRHLLKEDDFAAVVLDVQMPGLDGFETATAIRERERTSEVPIIFLTAIDRDEEHRLQGFAAGAADYIFKPVDPGVLRAKVAVFVRLYLADRELRRQSEELRRQSEDLRRRSEELARSNSDLDQFASVASHDLREPLNVITGYLELISDRLGPELDAQTAEWMQRVNGCAERMSGLIDELLAYSRDTEHGEGAGAVAALDDALADALANLEGLIAGRGARVEVPAGLPPARGSRRELTQLFQNIIRNSVVHGGPGPVTVSVSADEDAERVTVRISDDGKGLPAGQMGKVFGMFERFGNPPSPSTGLGLAICRKIATRLGGRIWMEPNADRGVSVVFQLPRPECP